MSRLSLGVGDLAHLQKLQQGLESLYRLDPAPEISPFLLDASDHSDRGEELFLIQGDDLQLGLALDPRAVAGLRDDHLGDHNLSQFCLVVEGISHFLFVIHRARWKQRTSALELELQSEVDKYVAAMMLARRCPKLASEQLRRRLYHGYALVDGLTRDEQQRYHSANGLAQRYARCLEERFVRQSKLTAMLGELRRFYRMSCWAKQDLIAGL